MRITVRRLSSKLLNEQSSEKERKYLIEYEESEIEIDN
jgi:hypothetical protein